MFCLVFSSFILKIFDFLFVFVIYFSCDVSGRSAFCKMAREGKISAMKIGFGENKVIIRVLYDLYTHVNTKNLSAIKNPLVAF